MSIRVFGVVVLLLGLAVTGYLFKRDAETAGPTSQLAQQAESQAGVAVADLNFRAAVPMLEAQRAETGTYEGAQLSPDFGVSVVRADATSYCLESGPAPAVEHLTGPNGTPQPGPCP
jgi:hypothetical protein